MQEAFRSRPGEIVPGSKNPPLKPSIGKDVRAFDTAEQFDESAEREAELSRAAMEALNHPSDVKSDPISGIRLSRKPNPLPDSPLSASGAGNVEVDVEVNREDPNDHEWAA